MLTLRKCLLWPVCALSWRAGLRIFFVYTGAQAILANPKYQDQKMLAVFFTLQPPPRAAEHDWLLIEGFFVAGFFMAVALNLINARLSGSWLKRGWIMGSIAWMLVIPWFEFYLPYNVLREPPALVLLESLLWFGVMLLVGLCASITLNVEFRGRTRGLV
ncbi:MAG TPA: hypothetical protein VGR59_15930 [Gemmatimonadaceae bacterium]|nr:hypothetical protein [Gemmatimonadaceae bacterium]